MPPLNPSQLPQMFQQGRRAEAAGNTAQARQTYQAILSTNPNIAEVQFQLGSLLLKAGRAAEAADHLDRAADLRPGEKAIWQVYGQAVQKLGNPERASQFLAKAKKARIDRDLLIALQKALRPQAKKSTTSLGSAPPQEVQRAISLLNAGRTDEALALAQRLFKAHPDVAVLADIIGYLLSMAGQNESAEAHYRRAMELDPNYAETRANYGQFLVREHRYDEAIPVLKSALALVPNLPKALAALGTAASRTYQFKLVITALSRLIELDPDNDSARIELAEALLNEKQYDQTLDLLEPLIDRDSPEGYAFTLRGLAHAAKDDNGAAMAAFDRAIEIDPKASAAYAEKARLLQFLGKFDEADAFFTSTIALNPEIGAIYRMYVATHKFGPDDPLIPQMEAQFEKATGQNRANFGFALAKALEDSKQYDRVFTYLRPANEYYRTLQPYDVSSRKALVDRYIEMFRDVDFSAKKVPNASGFAPIFVTGLPRSGTTLVEQIIASHSTVAGGGELGYAHGQLSRAIDVGGANSRSFDLSGEELAALGREAAEQMRPIAPGSDHITDKSVQTYLLIGPVRLALPKSRIVVVHRDPRDTALSMYKNQFMPGRHLYTYSLSDLGHYYHYHREIVDFWREKLPGWFYEIEYEALLDDPETQARALIDACGLEWEDACLKFHENKRRVDTLSMHQVRQPLYKSSVKSWERYTSELGELFDALGPEWAPETV
ncbi:tetratricopeptide repeat-containing sulfotransferase family protein [Pseudoruegeria sp. HB172150]|uniref:tetratricopeptide repeat-containing sulfotransferase family protein n=1 Tax=Pseudoruegeria sp. HB172150 TaxID=2721164 RepID=UPI0015574B7B|nr:tetratricopeptide repeat-containing sulfotransferase family protein [Pseudoruegeria sp. HB172150]